jgi:hypothetical protein
MVVNNKGESHVGSCRWTINNEGRELGLDREIREIGRLTIVANT